MAFAELAVSLRPVKFAMLVNPDEDDALLQAIQINTFLWGGTYNPIIPVFSETPSNWSHLPLKPPSPDKIVEGYIRFFDPDVLVACGTVNSAGLERFGRNVVTAEELTGPLTESGIPEHGIGLIEILAGIAEREFKFVRRDGLKVFMPTYDKDAPPFLKILFGDLPGNVNSDIFQEVLKRLDAETPLVTMDNYHDVSEVPCLFRRQVCSYGLNIRRPSHEQGNAIFYLDHTLSFDLIDFWNLRAVGWYVLPVPKAKASDEKSLRAARKFIADHEGPDVGQPDVRRRVTIIKSRSTAQPEHEAFVQSLRERPEQIMTLQVWYPPLWDEFAHMRGHMTCSEIHADTREIAIDSDEPNIRINALTPEFMAEVHRNGWRYANDVRLADYRQDKFRAAVIPPEAQPVIQRLGAVMPHDWRVGPGSLTYLGHNDSGTFFQRPNPRDLIEGVLAARGWTDFKFSPAGNVAYQMLNHLGGPWGIGTIKSRPLIEYLENLSRGIGRYDLAPTFFARIKQIDGASPIQGDIHRRVKRYTDANIFTLGVEVQCPACTQRSWYAIDSVKYDVQCPKCLAGFKLPIHNPASEMKWAYKNLGPFSSPVDDDAESDVETPTGEEVKWAYKSLGPFAAPKQGGGSYGVLLTVRFLSDFLHPAVTPVLSFTAKNVAGKELETDFMMFYRSSAFWERQIEWVFGECKTFNAIKKRDVDRMRVIADEFPNSVIVFSTLKDEFSQEEKDLLTPFVSACRCYGKLDRPRNPVLLLTGTELFAPFGPPQCWKGKSDKRGFSASRHVHTLLDLCQLTQSLYLDFGGWSVDWDEEFKKRRVDANSGAVE